MKPIRIVGGGLAGLALGIALRREDVSVSISEAGAYPRHRVCGEFISGRGLELLKELGGSDVMSPEISREATNASFFVKERRLGQRQLPKPALCVSRHDLDALLARKFREIGGTLHENTREPEDSRTAGMILATGRRKVSADIGGWRWFGLKAHFSNLSLESDLEMRVGENAYVGACRLPGGFANVCGLLRRKAGDGRTSDIVEMLAESVGGKFQQRLLEARVERSSICAVAGLCPRRFPSDAAACRIGDAWSMIPPITGNGMSMAFESASIAAPLLLAYANGSSSWEKATGEIAGDLDRAFGRRLRWAALMQKALFAGPTFPRAAGVFFQLGWKPGFALTR